MQALQDLLKPHVDSFDDMLDQLPLMIQNLDKAYFEIDGHLVTIDITDASIGKPVQPVEGNLGVTSATMYPSDCRARATTYNAPLSVTYLITSSSGQSVTLQRQVSRVPVMLKSSRCNLRSLTPLQLIHRHEEPEVGGTTDTIVSHLSVSLLYVHFPSLRDQLVQLVLHYLPHVHAVNSGHPPH